MENAKVKLFGETFIVKFPNVSEHMEIEAMKQSLTNGKYGEMVRAGVRTTDRNLDLVDAISTFSVLIPDLKARYKGASLMSIEVKDGLSIAKAYLTDYLPWYNAIMTKLDEEYKALGNESTVS